MAIKVKLRFKDISGNKDYISLEIAKLKSPDQFGHDYTAYVNRLEESKVNEPVKPTETPKRNAKLQRRFPKTRHQKKSPSDQTQKP